MRHRLDAKSLLATLIAAGLTASCAAPEPEPPAECAAAWRDSSAIDVRAGLLAVTVAGDPVWASYGLEDGAYVVNAGESSEGRYCLGVIRAGAMIAYGALATQPRYLTPLYGYHFLLEERSSSVDGLAALGEQPAEIRDWLVGLGVESAVVIPANVEGFPFEITPLHLVQLAIHEGFHVVVQTPRWLGYDADWPLWDRQPDRPAVRACYTDSDASAAAFRAERESLLGLVRALFAGNREAACTSGRQFLDLRDARYRLLTEVVVPDHVGTNIGCAAGENLMELEEGTADYASWGVLYEKGLATREQLVGRYGAQQAEAFYLTGAMALHAVRLMNPEGFLATTQLIANSATPAEGAPAAVLERGLEAYCR